MLFIKQPSTRQEKKTNKTLLQVRIWPLTMDCVYRVCRGLLNQILDYCHLIILGPASTEPAFQRVQQPMHSPGGHYLPDPHKDKHEMAYQAQHRASPYANIPQQRVPEREPADRREMPQDLSHKGYRGDPRDFTRPTQQPVIDYRRPEPEVVHRNQQPVAPPPAHQAHQRPAQYRDQRELSVRPPSEGHGHKSPSGYQTERHSPAVARRMSPGSSPYPSPLVSNQEMLRRGPPQPSIGHPPPLVGKGMDQAYVIMMIINSIHFVCW